MLRQCAIVELDPDAIVCWANRHSFGGNEDMRFVLRYLTDFLRTPNISVDELA